MRIVLGLLEFSGFAGTETYTLTLAEELQRLGHDVVIHAGTLGPVADAAAERGVVVVEGERQLPATCDAVVTQDAASAHLLGARYPRARRLTVVHSDYFGLQSPPQLAGVCDGAVVLNERVGRYVASLAAHPPIVRLRQPVDLKRFGVRGGEPRRDGRALILGNYLRGAGAELVAGACRDAGFEPVLSGLHGTITPTPEQAIADADAVIGLGRCVVEALAGRRAAFVLGIAGGDGWVTADSYAELEADGFAGTATPATFDRDGLAQELARWQPDMGPLNRQLADVHHSSARHAIELVEQLEEIVPRAAAAPSGGAAGRAAPEDGAARELARLVRLEWQTWGRYAGSVQELRVLREALDAERASAAERVRVEQEAAQRLRTELEQGRAEAAQRLDAALDAALEAERAVTARLEEAQRGEAAALARLTALKATRRYRATARAAAPFDALRRRLPRRGR